MIRLPALKPRLPPPAKAAGDKAAPDKRWAGNIDIKVDVAACIRNGFLGLAVLLLAVAALLNPDQMSAQSLAQTIYGFSVR